MQPSRMLKLAACLVGLWALLAPDAAAADSVEVQVDATTTHQTMDGFGATTEPLIFGDTDNVRADLRPLAIEAAYGDVGLNMAALQAAPFESPTSSLYSPANDDDDPSTFNADGFNWSQSDNLWDGVIEPAASYGLDNYFIGRAMSETFEFQWAKPLRNSDYDRYLDECAEHVAAIAIHWRDAYGATPRYLQLWNEPLSGNREMRGATLAELVDIVKRAGARLRAEGFEQMRFVVPAEETVKKSFRRAQAILEDPDARPFVGAIAYHPYPYSSAYASVPNILSTSGAGAPDVDAVARRNQLRDLAQMYGVPVWMNEVSHSSVEFGNFDGVRGRAIHIHDALTYTNAAAFFGMHAFWDSATQEQHYEGRDDPGLYNETDTIVLINNDTGAVDITAMGYAIGHYARWIDPGAVRLEATSSHDLVQITAFRNEASGEFVVVAVNNSESEQSVNVSANGLTLDGTLRGEQSTAAARWQALTLGEARSDGFAATLPAESVTSLAAPIEGASPGNAGVDAGSSGADVDASSATDVGDTGPSGADVDASSATDVGDTGSSGSGGDAAAVDASAPANSDPSAESGCECQAAGSWPPVSAMLLLAALALWFGIFRRVSSRYR